MVVTVKVEGFDAFMEAAESHKGKEIFALFSGSVGADGKSWCPDCVTAAPVVTDGLQYAPEDAVYIYCSVGGRDFWKDQSNVFRKDPKLQLKGVPTLLKYGKPKKLVEEQCFDAELVKMFFEED